MPPRARIGPVILAVAGDAYVQSIRITAILWEGATTAGDTCELIERSSGNVLFVGRALGAQTWEGVVLEMSAPGGFMLTQISSGRVLVYVADP